MKKMKGIFVEKFLKENKFGKFMGENKWKTLFH